MSIYIGLYNDSCSYWNSIINASRRKSIYVYAIAQAYNPRFCNSHDAHGALDTRGLLLGPTKRRTARTWGAPHRPLPGSTYV